MEEAAQQKAGADDEDTCQRYFRDDQYGPQALVVASGAGAGAGVFEGFLEVSRGDFEAGSKAEEEADGDSYQHSPCEHDAIDADAVHKRQRD